MAQARPPRAGAGGGPVLGTWLEKTRTSDARESIEVGAPRLPLPPPAGWMAPPACSSSSNAQPPPLP